MYKLITKIVEEQDSGVFRGQWKHGGEKGPIHLDREMAREDSTEQVTLDKQKHQLEEQETELYLSYSHNHVLDVYKKKKKQKLQGNVPK